MKTAKKNYSYFWVALVCLLSLAPLIMWGKWDDGAGAQNGFKILNGNSLSIKQWETCQFVKPKSCPGTGIFVPTKTKVQWRAFVSANPSCVIMSSIPCEP